MNDKLHQIQQKLHAPKGQMNKFGGYKYRSCEDILEAVKPLLAETGTTLRIYDTAIECGGWVFIQATAELRDGDNIIATGQALARHEDQKKGMDASQVSGAASSYARKYALNGLFLIDDTRDSDATNTHGNDGNEDGRGKKASKANLNKIKAAIDKHGVDADKVKAMMTGSPFACINPPMDLLAVHVDTVIDRIETGNLEVVK